MLVLSATYNLWPISRAKWVLRRFDHSAIYILIAATYTPFIMELKDSYFAIALLIGVWCVAIVGVVLKLTLPGRFDRLSVGLYLAMGWSGMMLYDAVVKALPAMAIGFVVAGGVLYSVSGGNGNGQFSFQAGNQLQNRQGIDEPDETRGSWSLILVLVASATASRASLSNGLLIQHAYVTSAWNLPNISLRNLSRVS